MTLSPLITLNDGHTIPQMGLGTWPLDDDGAEKSVATAIEGGYRLVDTAENYENERGVGRGLRASGVPREELFVTTKFNRRWHSVDGVREAFERSVERLGVDYLDLLLVHWPNPDQGRYVEAFESYDVQALTRLLHEEATLSMPPFELWLQGHDSIASWLLGRGLPCRGSRLVPVAACGGTPPPVGRADRGRRHRGGLAGLRGWHSPHQPNARSGAFAMEGDGGPCRDRTDDIHGVNVALYQLS